MNQKKLTTIMLLSICTTTLSSTIIHAAHNNLPEPYNSIKILPPIIIRLIIIIIGITGLFGGESGEGSYGLSGQSMILS